MHKDSAAIQDSKPFKRPKLLPRLLIESFTGVHNERTSNWGSGARLANVTPKGQRMGPAIILDDANGEISPSQLGPKGVVVANGSHAAEKISYASPPQAIGFGYCMMLRNYLWKVPVYIFSPVDVIAIRRIPHSRKQRELKMIVRVYEPREDQESV